MRIRDCSLRYGDNVLFEHFDLTVEDNELILFVAPSGYGKTTLFRAIAGLVTPAHGTIEDVGVVAYAFQEPRLLPWYSAVDNVSLVRDDRPKEEARALLLSLGLTAEACEQKADELSGGMRQRVNLARSFYYEGDILLLDEPFAGLDEANAGLVMKEILRQKESRPVLMISHERDFDAYADRIISMEAARS